MSEKMFDVAKFILAQHGSMSAMKLQKLMYYAQAWHLVWEEVPLFEDDFEAWANGPVLQRLYAHHRGMFIVDGDTFKDVGTEGCSLVSSGEQKNILKVLKFYGDKTAQWLSELTHQEDPWLKARKSVNAQPGDSCDAIISKASMHEYYSGL